MKTMKIFFSLIFVFSFYLSNAQYAKDTIVRKKYLDSLKNELASYTVSSYQYLNWYDRSQEELRKVSGKYQIGQMQFNDLLYQKRKDNISYGLAICCLMILSFTAIVMFNQK